MHPLTQAENARYRTLAGYETEALPVFLMLKNRNWQLVRGLILKQWQRIETQTQREFFDRQNGPEYLRSRYDQRRGAYPSRLIYLPHEFYPAWGWPLCALDQTRRVTAGTMAPRQKPELRLAAEEKEGYDFIASRQNANTDAREQVAGELLRAAQILSRNAALGILLEADAPRLGQLSSGAGNALGYVAYFLECWQRFHEYEQAPPAAPGATLAGALVEPAPGKLSLRQVALLYVYSGRVIPPTADAIAQQYGHASGRTLYKRYLIVIQRAGRIGEDVQGKALAPMLADITAVIPHLTGPHRQQAENERQTLEAKK